MLLLGGSGTIGRATCAALVERGYRVICPLRSPVDTPAGSQAVTCDLHDPASFENAVFGDHPFDAVITCLAARTGSPEEAWAVDYELNASILRLAKKHGIGTFVLLSAICVQKPRLQFQFAKLAFEKMLAGSGLDYSIVRPTAFFKSLSGQIDRVRKGKPFLVFGNGELTACKPISDADLANYLVDCIEDRSLQNRILPIGGPGPAITPLEQGQHLFHLLGTKPAFRRVPVSAMSAVIAMLSIASKVSKRAGNMAELARIGHYYATESMLLYDPETSRYNPDITPSYGSQTLFDHYRGILNGEIENERVDTSVF